MARYTTPSDNIFFNTPVTQTAISYTALQTDYIIEVTNTASARTITLPAPSTTGTTVNVGKFYIIKDTSGAAMTNNITVAPVSGTIDGQTSLVIANNFGWLAVFCDGTAWYSSSFSALAPYAVRQISASTYTALTTDNVIESDFAGAVTVTLPTPASVQIGHVYIIKDYSGLAATNNITVKSAAGNIDGTAGSTGIIIATNYGSTMIYNDGTNYYTIFQSTQNLTPSSDIQAITSSQTYTPAANIQYALVECIGGGGGGGGASATSAGLSSNVAGGGGAGGYARATLSSAQLTAAAPISVVINSGGGGGSTAGTAGSAGGTVQFGSPTFLVQATGGTGGTGSAAPGSSVVVNGGAGGTGSLAGGVSGFVATGNAGGGGFGFSPTAGQANAVGGFGAGSFLGGGALQAVGNQAGQGATSHGAGGGGASIESGSQPGAAGGTGTNGIVIVTEYILAPPPVTTNASITWNTFSGVSGTMVAGNGYYTTNSGAVTLTLPTTAAAGTVLAVTGVGTGLWTIAQNAGQTIQFGAQVTTNGTGGSLVASAQGNGVYLLCTTANFSWIVLDSVGNITVN